MRPVSILKSFFILLIQLSIVAPLSAKAEGEMARGSHSGDKQNSEIHAKSEFGGICVEGLAQGRVIPTTCTIHWTSPEGKIYCFQNNTSKALFLKNPEGHIKKARDYYASLDPSKLKTKAFTEEEVEERVLSVIRDKTKEGLFNFYDPRLGKKLQLKYEKIKIVRGMAGYGWFPNVIFQDKDIVDKKYAIDFWFKPLGQELHLMDIRVQKGPIKDGNDYYMKTRQPVAWWWLPVSEHPGDAEVTRAWHVIAAIHSHIQKHQVNGVYYLKDEKTGKKVPLEFVEIHQPVRRLNNNGTYFACTDFRKKGSKNEFYDVDFWLNKKTGKIAVGSVRIHKVPVQDQENGLWYQEKRYNFKGLNFEVVN